VSARFPVQRLLGRILTLFQTSPAKLPSALSILGQYIESRHSRSFPAQPMTRLPTLKHIGKTLSQRLGKLLRVPSGARPTLLVGECHDNYWINTVQTSGMP